jgi:hypothetical protein
MLPKSLVLHHGLSQFQTWTPVTVSELKAFLGLVFVTGIIDKPTLNIYWSEDPVFETPIFSKTMVRNRFESILSFLHFSDSSRYDTRIQCINIGARHYVREYEYP